MPTPSIKETISAHDEGEDLPRMGSEREVVQPSLASGSALAAASWADFVKRLHHDCVGEGVRGHLTAEALFTVQARRIVSGIDRDYASHTLVAFEENCWYCPEEYWADCDGDERSALDAASQADSSENFLDLDTCSQWEILGALDGHTVTGWEERWEYVNSHFTKAAAEAFIARKKHDYRDGIRVYVEAQIYCWEFNAIKAGILNGSIQFVATPTAQTQGQSHGE